MPIYFDNFAGQNKIQMNDKSFNWYSGPFVARLEKDLIDLCTQRGFLNGQLYKIEELEQFWHHDAPDYMADAVPNIAHYPTVSIAWAAYYGLGAAALWDTVWDKVKDQPNLYIYLRDVRGFDNFDDYIVESILNLLPNNPTRANELTKLLQDCAEIALSLIRKEGINPQTVEAFHMFAKTTETFFKLGVSLELFAQGYHYEKIDLSGNNN